MSTNIFRPMGFVGAVAKADAARDLAQAVETVLKGGTFFPPGRPLLAERLRNKKARAHRERQAAGRLWGGNQRLPCSSFAWGNANVPLIIRRNHRDNPVGAKGNSLRRHLEAKFQIGLRRIVRVNAHVFSSQIGSEKHCEAAASLQPDANLARWTRKQGLMRPFFVKGTGDAATAHQLIANSMMLTPVDQPRSPIFPGSENTSPMGSAPAHAVFTNKEWSHGLGHLARFFPVPGLARRRSASVPGKFPQPCDGYASLWPSRSCQTARECAP